MEGMHIQQILFHDMAPVYTMRYRYISYTQ